MSWPVDVTFEHAIVRGITDANMGQRELQPEITHWMDRHVGERYHDWDVHSLDCICFVFEDPQHAMLFKLTWA